MLLPSADSVNSAREIFSWVLGELKKFGSARFEEFNKGISHIITWFETIRHKLNDKQDKAINNILKARQKSKETFYAADRLVKAISLDVVSIHKVLSDLSRTEEQRVGDAAKMVLDRLGSRLPEIKEVSNKMMSATAEMNKAQESFDVLRSYIINFGETSKKPTGVRSDVMKCAGIGAAAGLGVAAVGLGAIAALNWWNPLGWILTAALAAQVICGVGGGAAAGAVIAVVAISHDKAEEKRLSSLKELSNKCKEDCQANYESMKLRTLVLSELHAKIENLDKDLREGVVSDDKTLKTEIEELIRLCANYSHPNANPPEGNKFEN